MSAAERQAARRRAAKAAIVFRPAKWGRAAHWARVETGETLPPLEVALAREGFRPVPAGNDHAQAAELWARPGALESVPVTSDPLDPVTLRRFALATGRSIRDVRGLIGL